MTNELPDGKLKILWDDGEFVVSRVSHSADRPPTLVVRPAPLHTNVPSLARLEHDYALRSDLDSSWAARPGALSIVLEAAHRGWRRR